jgi:DNA-binding NarL/FixJ family response regulator
MGEPAGTARTIRLLLVDSRPWTLRGLHMWLAEQPGLLVVGESRDGAELPELIRELAPDVVLMDVELVSGCCVTAAAAVHSTRPELPLVLLGLRDDVETRDQARSAGAAALVAKHELEPLVRTIRSVAGGRCGHGLGHVTGPGFAGGDVPVARTADAP